MTDKKALQLKLKTYTSGQANLDWFKDEVGEDVFEWLVKNTVGNTFRSAGFWTNSREGSYYVSINLETGYAEYDCSVAALENDIHLPTHRDRDIFATHFRKKIDELLDKRYSK